MSAALPGGDESGMVATSRVRTDEVGCEVIAKDAVAEHCAAEEMASVVMRRGGARTGACRRLACWTMAMAVVGEAVDPTFVAAATDIRREASASAGRLVAGASGLVACLVAWLVLQAMVRSQLVDAMADGNRTDRRPSWHFDETLQVAARTNSPFLPWQSEWMAEIVMSTLAPRRAARAATVLLPLLPHAGWHRNPPGPYGETHAARLRSC